MTIITKVLVNIRIFANCTKCPCLDQFLQQIFTNDCQVVVWHSGSMLVSIKEVDLCQTRLVLGWVIMFNFQCRTSTSVCNHSPRSTQPGYPIMGRRGTMSTSQTVVTPCGKALKAGMVRVWVAGKTCDPPVTHGLYKFTFTLLCLLRYQHTVSHGHCTKCAPKWQVWVMAKMSKFQY